MDTLHSFFRHHAWATLRLIDHCLELPPERLLDESPGTRGTIWETLTHLVDADQRYLAMAESRTTAAQAHEGQELTLAELRAAFENQASHWEVLVDRAGELDVTVRRWDGTEMRHATDAVLVQAIHHGNDHRTHVCTVLGSKGLEVPDLSGWAYWRATHT
jgi:uncharacterized damage-inducible protein DinB